MPSKPVATFKDSKWGKFRANSGSYLTKALFLETNTFDDNAGVMFTLKAKDHNGLPSFRRLYLEIADPTEYKVANELLDGWDHWLKISNAGWFIAHLEGWRRELEAKLLSEAVESIKQEVKTGKNPLSAAKWLAAKGWMGDTKNPDTPRPRGRPSKQEIDNRLNEQAVLASDLDADAKRILN